jgi:chromosomal replication initiation ATPase DnaA
MFGALSHSAVSKAHHRLSRKIEKDRALKGSVKKILNNVSHVKVCPLLQNN